MPKIKLDPKLDLKVERLAPRYLKGPRKAAQRVAWACEQVVELFRDRSSKRKAG